MTAHTSNPDLSRLRPRRSRTRTGCLSCRQRRKKCDERKPRCVGCERNKLSCIWQAATKSPRHDDQTKAVAISHSNGRDIPRPTQSRAYLDISKALEAQRRPNANHGLSAPVSKSLQHYLSHTADTLYALTPPFMEGLWTRMVLGQAQAHPFLMDSVNAITTFHCAYLYPAAAPRYIKMARLSNAAGLSKFRKSVVRIDERNATAILAFTFIQNLLCMTSPFATGIERTSETIDSLRDLLVALRGFYRLQPATCPYITDPAITNWLKNQPDRPPVLDKPYNEELLPHVLRLAVEIDKTSFPAQEKCICRTVLASLYTFFAGIPLEPRNWAVLFTWPVTLPDEFLDLVSAWHPLALAITAYWAVSVFQGQHWLFHRWADRTFRDVASIVGPKYLYLLHGLVKEAEYQSGSDVTTVAAGHGFLEQEVKWIPHHCKNPLVEQL